MKKLIFVALIAASGGWLVAQTQAPEPNADQTLEAVQVAPTPAPPSQQPRPERQLQPRRQGNRPAAERAGGTLRQRNENEASVEPIARIKQAAAELLKMYDLDKDGKLSDQERALMEKDLAEAETKARLAREYWRVKAVDVDGDLQISTEEEKESMQRLREAVRQRMGEMQRDRENIRRRERPGAIDAPATPPRANPPQAAPATAPTAQ